MKIFLLLALAVPSLPTGQEPLSKSRMNRLIRSLETGSEKKAEEAAQRLLAGGVEVLPRLPDVLVRLAALQSRGDVTHERIERVRGLRMAISAEHEDAFEEILLQADDSRAAVRIRAQFALAVLPGDPSSKLIERWGALTEVQRESSIYALIAAGDESARDHLVATVQAVESESVNARYRAAMGLRVFEPNGAAIAALEAAVGDPNERVGIGACTTLWSYGAEGVSGLMLAMVGSRKSTVADAASVLLVDLGDVSKEAVTEALLKSPRDRRMLRAASMLAPADRVTVEAFEGLRGTNLVGLQEELLDALPRVAFAEGVRVRVLADALVHSTLAVVEKAALTALHLEDAEFLALREPLRSAWLRPKTSHLLIQRLGAAVTRLALPVEEHLEWCAQRMILEGDRGKLAAAVLAGTIPAESDEALARRIRTSAADDQIYWLSSLVGREGNAQEILSIAATSSPPHKRPFILGYLAMGGYGGEDAVALFEDALSDPRSPSGNAVLRGFANLGRAPEGLMTPLLRAFDELQEAEQALVLRAAGRSETVSKRLSSVAREALLESPFERVRSAAAMALTRVDSSKGPRVKALRAALLRIEEPAGSAARGTPTVGVIATALAELEANDKATASALAAVLEGPRSQVVSVAEALRRIGPASAPHGEALADRVWNKDLVIRGACLKALCEIEGASLHADSVLASVALVQYADLAGLALDGLEALALEERALAAPYLECVSIRNPAPLFQLGWGRPPMEEPWAKEYKIPGPLAPQLGDLAAFENVRKRALALLE